MSKMHPLLGRRVTHINGKESGRVLDSGLLRAGFMLLVELPDGTFREGHASEWRLDNPSIKRQPTASRGKKPPASL